MVTAFPEKWKALRAVARTQRGIGYAILGVGGIVCVGIIFAWAMSPAQSSQQSQDFLSSGITLLVGVPLVGLITFSIANGYFAKAEMIMLLIAIEENTRSAAEQTITIAASVAQNSSNGILAPVNSPPIWPTSSQ